MVSWGLRSPEDPQVPLNRLLNAEICIHTTTETNSSSHIHSHSIIEDINLPCSCKLTSMEQSRRHQHSTMPLILSLIGAPPPASGKAPLIANQEPHRPASTDCPPCASSMVKGPLQLAGGLPKWKTADAMWRVND